MSAEDKLKARMENLITQGELLLKTQKSGSDSWGASVEVSQAIQWTASVHQVVKLSLSGDSTHFKRLEALTLNRHESDYAAAEGALAILRASLDDFSGGYISLHRLVEAEVYDSLLEQSEELLSKGYKDAAAVLIGGVLEEHLRSMCSARGISTARSKGGRKTIDNTLNADLAKAGAYNKLKQKQITAWADLRNNAAHGNYSEYNKADVSGFLEGVLNFCANLS